MSSYVTSPYYIEQRRLQGIVNQCAADLQCALRAVENQKQEIEKKKEAQLRKDASFFREQELGKQSYLRQQEKENEQLQHKKESLCEELHNIWIELQVYETKIADMQGFMNTQKQLEEMLGYETVDLIEIEKKIHQHKEAIQVKVASFEGESAEGVMPVVTSINYGKREKGVSLDVIDEEEDAWIEEPLAEDVFMQKLNVILQSSAEGNYGYAAKLKQQFEAQPEYAKTVFAVQHMNELESVLQKVQVLEERRKQKQKEYETLVDKYQAICTLLALEPDDKYINDVDKIHALKKLCEKLYQTYEQKKQKEYVYHAVVTVMNRYGIEVYNDSSHTSQDCMHFQLEHANLEVSGIEHDQMVMEVTGEYDGLAPTLNERRQGVLAAQKFCSVLDNIYDDLEYEFGVTFTRILAKRPSEENITMKQKNKHVSSKWYKAKAGRSIQS